MSFRVVLVRHGEAGPGRPDEARTLTPRGESETRSVASRLAIDPAQTILCCSTYVRARQTAAIIADQMGIAPSLIRVTDGITPDDDPVTFVARLTDEWLPTLEEKTVVIVTHMPFVSALRGLLVDGNIRYGVPFATSETQCLEGNAAAVGAFMVSRTLLPKS